MALPFTLLSVAVLACRWGVRTANPPETLRLPVRVHLLTSATGGAVATTWTDRDVHELFRVANGIWRQAGIEWHLERVLREESPASAQFDSLIAEKIPRTEANLIAFVPRGHLLRPGWNVFLIRDFGRIAGGMFRPELAGVVLAERGFGVELPASGRGGATLAHELGHSLGLGHVACDSTRDIMANACWSPMAMSTLTPAQIADARRQARLGSPTAEMPSP